MFRQIFCTIFVVAFFAGIWFGLWSAWKNELLRSEQYRLDPARFHLPPPLPWIPETLVHEVLLAANFEADESVLDTKLPEKLAAAFKANPWVLKVRKVQIQYPAEIFVELEYRSPVCLVELPNGDGFYPVDSQGVLLPTDYFTQGTPKEIAEKMDAFVHVTDAPSNPIGSFGDAWGHPAVEKAAKIAALLGKDAELWGIVAIRILTEKKAEEFALSWNTQPPQFQLLAANGHAFDWGTFDFSSEIPQLPSLEEDAKKEKLRYLIQQHGTLANIPDIPIR